MCVYMYKGTRMLVRYGAFVLGGLGLQLSSAEARTEHAQDRTSICTSTPIAQVSVRNFKAADCKIATGSGLSKFDE